MIFKCGTCSEPMTPSTKNKPDDLSKEAQWILCRKCNHGVAVVGTNPASIITPSGKPVEVQVMRFTETKVNYIEMSHVDGKTIKAYYSNDKYENKIGEEEI